MHFWVPLRQGFVVIDPTRPYRVEGERQAGFIPVQSGSIASIPPSRQSLSICHAPSLGALVPASEFPFKFGRFRDSSKQWNPPGFYLNILSSTVIFKFIGDRSWMDSDCLVTFGHWME